jgi:hypothetical protein
MESTKQQQQQQQQQQQPTARTSTLLGTSMWLVNSHSQTTLSGVCVCGDGSSVCLLLLCIVRHMIQFGSSLEVVEKIKRCPHSVISQAWPKASSRRFVVVLIRWVVTWAPTDSNPKQSHLKHNLKT